MHTPSNLVRLVVIIILYTTRVVLLLYTQYAYYAYYARVVAYPYHSMHIMFYKSILRARTYESTIYHGPRDIILKGTHIFYYYLDNT